MKRNLIVGLQALLLALGLTGVTQAVAKDDNAPPPPADAYVLEVNGLACPYCAFGVEKQFRKQDGVTGVDIDIAKGRVVVHVQPAKRFSDAQLKQLIHDAGFAVGRIVSRPQNPTDQS